MLSFFLIESFEKNEFFISKFLKNVWLKNREKLLEEYHNIKMRNWKLIWEKNNLKE